MTQQFYLGLTMAGAISAGAYNGGVFDFLMEALDAWEKQRGKPDVPTHRVIIPVMSGASAGGITGALGLIALADGTADKTTYPVDRVGEVTATLPRLYNAWVRLPRFVGQKKGDPCLLGDGDFRNDRGEIDKSLPVVSLLDSSLLMAIARNVMIGIASLHQPRPYLSDNLHLFLTHSNLRGVPYEIPFGGGVHAMMAHADRVHYTLTGLGSTPAASPWADNDSWVPLSVASLPQLKTLNENHTGDWDLFTVSTLGTSAFPVGLAARVIRNIGPSRYQGRQWPAGQPATVNGQPYCFRLTPQYSIGIADLTYTTIDGGMLNNEPFELARWPLMQTPPQGNPRDETQGGKVDRAVLMIDPFPEAPDFDMAGFADNSLLAVLKKIFPTFKNHARFKVDDLVAAGNDSIYSRYLIMPVRKAVLADGTVAPDAEPFGIACGLLGGFGGFLDEAMRAHDYQLGRLNCYLFLKNHFAMPDGYAVVKDGYANVADKNDFRPGDPAGGPHLQIIPVKYVDQPVAPAWPRVNEDTVDEMVDKAMERAKLVLSRLGGDLPGMGLKFVAWLGWLVGKGALRDIIHAQVVKDLIRRDQYVCPNLPPRLPSGDRAVLAAMVTPGSDYMTLEDIARAATSYRQPVTVEDVERIIAPHIGKLVKLRLDEQGGRTYRLPI